MFKGLQSQKQKIDIVQRAINQALRDMNGANIQ